MKTNLKSKLFIRGFKSLLFASCTFLSMIANVEAASIKVNMTFPANSAGAGAKSDNKTLPVATKISPCKDPKKPDSASFTVNYDVTNPVAKQPPLDVYILFYNPDGINKIYSVSKTSFTLGGFVVTPYYDATKLSTAAVPVSANVKATLTPYVVGIDAPSTTAAVTETLFGSDIGFDKLDTGTWQLIGIVADSLTVNFNDPSTWAAWDVVTVMFGLPWKGAGQWTGTNPTLSTAVCQ